MKYFILVLFTFVALQFRTLSNEIYFPPLAIGQNWDTISPNSLNWNIEKIPALYTFLEEKRTKAFILLKDGKIVLEKYFDGFGQDSNWYWASAGKTLTSALVGVAQDEGLLNINDKTSKYLGIGWTTMTSDKEELITIRHQLTMTTGLDFSVEDLDCTESECLKYKADAGTQWFYHNAPYTLLDKVIENASSQNFNIYFSQKIRNKIGMNGLWLKLDNNNVYFSTARSMARFGLLIMNDGKWNDTQIIKDSKYFNEMINTSNDLNKSYGYLWWLNGKESFMIPGTTKVFQGDLIVNAPNETISALGKNGQILNISQEEGLVWVRMGDKPDEQLFISSNLSNQIWGYLNEIMDTEMSVHETENFIGISPNPASEYITIQFQTSEVLETSDVSTVQVSDMLGIEVMSESIYPMTGIHRMNIEHLPVGLYFIQIGNYLGKFMVVR